MNYLSKNVVVIKSNKEFMGVIMEQETKLLDYIRRIIELEDGEEYLKVSDIGYVLTELFGAEKTITGQKVNQMLQFNRFQVPLADDELFTYYPTEKFDLFVECINEKMGYGLIKWHYTIIPRLLRIDFTKNVKKNIEKIQDSFIYIYYIKICHIDIDILQNELLKIGVTE